MSLEIFKTRYSCRNFKKEALKEEHLKEILEVARLSPSSLGLEPWKFLVVRDAKKKEELSFIANHQSHIKDAAAVIIILSRLDFAEYFEEKLRQRKMREEELQKRLSLYKPFFAKYGQKSKNCLCKRASVYRISWNFICCKCFKYRDLHHRGF